jgi:hypothetical protein
VGITKWILQWIWKQKGGVEIKEKTGGFLAHHFPGVFQ